MGSVPSRSLVPLVSKELSSKQHNDEVFLPAMAGQYQSTSCSPTSCSRCCHGPNVCSDIYTHDRDDIAIIKSFVGANVNITFTFNDCFSPLFVACHYGLTDVVSSLVTKNFDVCSPDVHGFTPLYIACYKGYYKLAKVLVEAKVDVNAGKGQYTPLYVAAKNGHEEVVRLLLESKANLYAVDSENNLAYDVAATTTIRKLLQDACEQRGYGLCAICWEHPVHGAFAFVPCGHNIVCRGCNERLNEKNIRTCPMCRSPIWCRVLAKYV